MSWQCSLGAGIDPTNALSLPDAQIGESRWRCCACAQELANRWPTSQRKQTDWLRCPHGSFAPSDVINLHVHQSGPARHKCAVCAFWSRYRERLEALAATPVVIEPPILTDAPHQPIICQQEIIIRTREVIIEIAQQLR